YALAMPKPIQARRSGAAMRTLHGMISSAQTAAVIGGGIVGLAVARELTIRYPGLQVTVFDKEDHVAAHQSGHNSGVVHAGLYYAPGTLKARLCVRGGSLLRELRRGAARPGRDRTPIAGEWGPRHPARHPDRDR